ncbi:hypothetical protein PVAR5_1151 [Paecilomyces variotii No. 5]|uniref:Uncharacterized protein n=1 Tax=Byssochlamys spectabilis (strain No. 5 / NBRC 109023) TaxID=1356009 RepID=V5FL59_BYSSN|nr:hypothetical protein PVAR5_1151 [Paecilomyces variotii No. 5]
MSFQPENQGTQSMQPLRHENQSPGSDLETSRRNEVADNETNDANAERLSLTDRGVPGSYSLMHPHYGHNSRNTGPELESTAADKLADPLPTYPRRSCGRPQYPVHPATPRKYRLHPLITTDHEHESPAPISLGANDNVHQEVREIAADDTDSSWGSPALSPIRTPYTYKWDDSLPEARLDFTDARASRRIVRRCSISGPPAGIQGERRSYPPVELKDGKPGIIKPIAPSDLALPFDLNDEESVHRYVSMITSRNRLSRFSNILINVNRQNREKTMNKSAAEDARVGAALQLAIVKYKHNSPIWRSASSTARWLQIICTLTPVDRAKRRSGNDLLNKIQSSDYDLLCFFNLAIHPSIVQTAIFLAALFELVLSTGVFSGLDDLIQPYVAKVFHLLLWICGILRLNRLVHIDISFNR